MLICEIGYGKIKLPALISDNMVLQQKERIKVWGWSDSQDEIFLKASWDPIVRSAILKKNGKWECTIETPEAGGPYTLEISSKDSKKILIKNILIGEVWISSGQSNMEMPLGGWPGSPVLNSEKEIHLANFPNIRFFNVQRQIGQEPKENVLGHWSICDSVNVKFFSAVAYFFAKELFHELNVPVGIINASVGATPAESWISEKALKRFSDFEEILNWRKKNLFQLEKLKQEEAKKIENWKDEFISQRGQHFSRFDFDDSNWPEMKLPNYWESAGLPGFDGTLWFRKEFILPEDWEGEDLRINLGPIDEMDITWVNGVPIGETTGDGRASEVRNYFIPRKITRKDKNVIAVKILDAKDNGGIYGGEEIPALYLSQEDQKLSLSGNWKYGNLIEKPSTYFDKPDQPSVLYNGMIAPFLSYVIKGVIWYQGESNVYNPKLYEDLFPTLIDDWRKNWQLGDFPFYFVQIAPFPDGFDGFHGPELREAQRKALARINTGMVVTMDIGDTLNIHPANKEQVGKRLSYWALAKDYNREDLAYSGPLFKEAQKMEDKVKITFGFVGKGLVLRNMDMNSFEIAGEDGIFYNAQIKIVDNYIIASSKRVEDPKMIRYGWQDTAQPCLFNKEGLPASGFSSRVH